MYFSPFPCYLVSLIHCTTKFSVSLKQRRSYHTVRNPTALLAISIHLTPSLIRLFRELFRPHCARRVRKIAKSDNQLRHVWTSVCLSVRMEQLGSTTWISTKFDIWVFFKNLSRNFMFMWSCIVTNFFLIKPKDALIFPNLFCQETLHVSGSSARNM